MNRILQAAGRMRATLALLLIAGCRGEPPLVMKPLPPLVAPEPRAQVRELVADELGLVAGEHWIWDVQVKGFSIGRVEMIVGDDEVESRFRTGVLASTVARVEHELVTTIDHVTARPISARERLDFAGKLRQFTTTFAGTTAHSFHTALGAIRAWAHPSAPAGFIHITHADKVFRLELQRPVALDSMLRVDGRVIGDDDVDLSLTIWIDAARAPVRVEIRDGNDRVTAELIAG